MALSETTTMGGCDSGTADHLIVFSESYFGQVRAQPYRTGSDTTARQKSAIAKTIPDHFALKNLWISSLLPQTTRPASTPTAARLIGSSSNEVRRIVKGAIARAAPVDA